MEHEVSRKDYVKEPTVARKGNRKPIQIIPKYASCLLLCESQLFMVSRSLGRFHHAKYQLAHWNVTIH
jgi:hypothetical protein